MNRPAPSDHLRRRVRALLALALAAAAVAAMVHPGLEDGPEPRLTAAAGALSISNSRGGGAIFETNSMAPGQSVEGSVRVGNDGGSPAAMRLTPSDLTDTPGPGGGVLSGQLDLVVADAAGTEPLYSGKLGEMGSIPLGRFEPGTARTYRFTVTLPDGGPAPSPLAGDNAFAGATTTVRYDWSATDASPAPPRQAKPPVTTRPAAGPRMKVKLSGLRRALSRRRVGVSVRCAEACRVEAYAGSTRARRSRVRASLPAGRWTRLSVPLTKKTVASLRRDLRRRGRATLRLTIRARNGKGVTSVSTRRVNFRVAGSRGKPARP